MGLWGLCCTPNMYRDDPSVFYTSLIQLRTDYELGAELGAGVFASVYKVTRARDGAQLAAKVFKKRMSIDSDNELSAAPGAERLKREVAILHSLPRHRHVLRFEAVLETASELHVLTQLCAGGDLMRHLVKRKTFTELDAARFTTHLLEAVAHCHRHGVMHRDVKPENLLVDLRKEATLVLADFGSAVVFKQGERFKHEVWSGDYDCRCDAYSCGVVVFVRGRVAFSSTRVEYLIQVLAQGMLTGEEVRQLHVVGPERLLDLQRTYKGSQPPASPDLRRLLKGLLAPAETRVAAAAALREPWLAAASGDRQLTNPAAAALRHRAVERAARVALATLDRPTLGAVRANLAPTADLPPATALLGDVLAALEAAPGAAAALSALAALDAAPGLVLVHQPFGLVQGAAEEPALPTVRSSSGLSALLTPPPAPPRARNISMNGTATC